MLDSARQLPPGQHAVELERFGLPQFARRHVDPPARPVLTVGGAVRRPTQLDVGELLARLPRREQRSDLHCVTTWSALDLAWSGAPFRDVAQLIVGVVQPDPRAHWLMAAGLDGFQSCLSLDDVLADDVLLADRLHGAALSPAHGAPLRLVVPAQYGYKSVKHLAALEYRHTYAAGSAGLREHPRGRVAQEERSRFLPGFVWRRIWALALPVARRPYRSR
ncbi:MAG: molybdopterin-dependent oxidoreductase [Actinomycetota bacterium]|nr:molybdopterin-dependent oxidoreductase [Actinomycetota bacterium]